MGDRVVLGWTITEPAAERFLATHSDGRTIAIKLPDPGDQLDAIEASSLIDDRYGRWTRFAMVAIAVTDLDGAPSLRPTKADQVRAKVRQLGNERWAVCVAVLFGEQDDAAAKAAADQAEAETANAAKN